MNSCCTPTQQMPFRQPFDRAGFLACSTAQLVMLAGHEITSCVQLYQAGSRASKGLLKHMFGRRGKE